MKINWGTGIVIAFILFISFILYFVITMNTNDKYKHDLVTKNYYKKELEYQKDIDKEENAKTLAVNVKYERTKEGLLLVFPSDMDSNAITGTVFLYRPSNKKLDFKMPIKVLSHTFLIPEKRLVGGRWNLNVDWKFNNKEYLFKQHINY